MFKGTVKYGWIDMIATPDKKLWTYDYQGGVQSCSLSGDCAQAKASADFINGSVSGEMMAYSKVDHDVYISDPADANLYQFTADGRKRHTFRSWLLQKGYGGICYFHGGIWIAFGGDAKNRPMIGRLSPSGKISYFSLPFDGPPGVKAMVEGPDHHLWYVRNQFVGEILSPI